MIKKLLIANRGEIAVRIIRACKELKIDTVAVYSEPDVNALHAQLATESYCIGGAASADSYLNIANILSVAALTGCDAVHPGCGFLSENAGFAAMVEKCGMKFIGPNPQVMEKMGDKAAACTTVKNAGIPVIPGSDGAIELGSAGALAEKIGYPVLIKAASGGGGRGIRIVRSTNELEIRWAEAQAEAKKFFSDDRMYIEKYIERPRHVEVQVMCDKFGHAVHLFERNCSVQRRNQKMLEEAPCFGLSAKLKNALYEAAVKVCRSVGYDNVGTVEFLLDQNDDFYFIEMNTRVQVEHCVTEEITGMDIIKTMIRLADGGKLPYKQSDISCNGHAIECRINAEDIRNNFRPTAGKINFLHCPGGNGIRIDTDLYTGGEVSPFYDSMILKMIAHAPTRLDAIRKMRCALEELLIEGVDTTVESQYMILHHPDFIRGDYDTGFVDEFLENNGTNIR